METRTLQSLIDRNSNEIRALEIERVKWKKLYKSFEHPNSKKMSLQQIGKIRKRIAKLVEIQRVLKEDISYKIGLRKFVNRITEFSVRVGQVD